MILRKLELSHFGRFSEANCEFRRGLNLVVGPNEAGKTTLMEAIPAILFGARDKGRFRSWGRRGESFGALTLETEAGTILIRRELTSDRVWLEEKDHLYQALGSFSGKASPQGRSAERRAYLERISDLFGAADEAVFRASLYFAQGALDLPGEQGLADKLKGLISGFGGGDYDQVSRALCDDYFSLTRMNPWGKDKSRDRELEELRGRQLELQEQIETLRQRLADGRRLAGESAGLEQRIETLRQDLNRGERYLDWVRSRWSLEEKQALQRRELERLDRALEKVGALRLRREEIVAELARRGLPAEEDGGLSALLAELRQQREDLGRVAAEFQDLRQRLAKLPRSRGRFWWRLAASVALLIGAGSWYLWPASKQPIGVATLGLVAVCLLLGYRQSVLRRAEGNALRQSLQALDRQRRSLLLGMEERSGRLAGLGISGGGLDPDRLERLWLESRPFYRELTELDGSLRVLDPPEELAEQRQALLREAAILNRRLEEGQGLDPLRDLRPHELPGAEEKLVSLRAELRDQETRLAVIQGRQAEIAQAGVGLQRLLEHSEQLDERIEAVQKRARALQLACEILGETVRDFREGLLERLAEQVGTRLSALTAGRYRQIRFDASLQPQLKIRNGSWQPYQRFSCGTRDAIHILTRLALQERLVPGRCLPLFLDDVLVNLDQERQDRVLDMLAALSAEHQIILLSHDQKLLSKAARERWHVLILNEPPEPVVNEEEQPHVGQLHLL